MSNHRTAKMRLLKDITPMISKIKNNLNSLDTDCKINKLQREII